MKKFSSRFVFILGIFLIFSGIYRQEVKIVLNKAILICLECIGLG